MRRSNWRSMSPNWLANWQLKKLTHDNQANNAMTEKKNVALWVIVSFAVIFVVALAYVASLLTTGKDSVLTAILLALLGIAGFVILLFGIAVAFSGMDALDPLHAFGLPRGTVRAVLALGLLVAFLTASFYWIDRAATQEPVRITQRALGPGAVVDPAGMQKALGSGTAVYLSVEKRDGVDIRMLNFVGPAASKDWLDLIKQVITVLSTALAAVVGFYFGSRSSDTSHKPADAGAGQEAERQNKAGKATAQLETARELMTEISADLQRVKTATDEVKAAYEKAKSSDPSAKATKRLATKAANAEKARARARDSETKARVLVTDIEKAMTGLAAKATTDKQAKDYDDQIATAMKSLKQQSVLAQAASDRARKLAGWSQRKPKNKKPGAPQPQTA